MTKHVHAELMRLYAEDAMETDKPWKHWEQWGKKRSGDGWVQMLAHPRWVPAIQYRRKPKVISINGHEVPEPLREAPPHGETIFAVALTMSDNVTRFIWAGPNSQLEMLRRGILHTTPEAAKLHARAILSFTQVDDDGAPE